LTSQRTEEEQKRRIVNRRHFSFRLNLFFFSTFFLFSVLIVKLAILQFVQGPELKAEEHSISVRNVPIPPIRGDILDSTGKRIAYSTATQSLYYTLDKGTKRAEDIAMAYRLADIFAKYGNPKEAMTPEEIVKKMDLDTRVNFAYTPRRIKSNLTAKEIAYFMEHKSEFKGVSIVEDSIRNYSENSVAVQLVGYLKKYKSVVETFDFYKDKNKLEDPTVKYLDHEEVGYDGLEYMYQDVLRGKNGVKTYPIDASSRIIGPPTVTKPEKGANLYLTINEEVQVRTEEAIMKHLEYLQDASRSASAGDYAPEAKTGYAVAIEVDTGKVVAMASMPDYDPNLWRGGTMYEDDYERVEAFINNGTIREVYKKYESQKEANKHTSSLVFLGSTQKPLTVLIGLKEGLFTTNTYYNDRGVFQFGAKGHERKIRNAENHAYGRMDPARAIEKSSNPFMAEMVGNQLYRRNDGLEGVEKWDSYVKQFGLGVKTGSGLPGESAGAAGYFDEAKNASAQSALIFASFGQQGKYTTLQLAQYVATLASRGHRMKPQFVEKIVAQDGTVLQSFQPEVLNKVEMPDAYWREIETGMKSGVKGFDGVNYTFNRKTGTSQQQTSLPKPVENAVFIAYAPAEKPKLAVAVVVPEGGYGGRGAAPIARQIFDAYDETIGLYGTPRPKPNAAAGATGAAAGGTGAAAAAEAAAAADSGRRQ